MDMEYLGCPRLSGQNADSILTCIIVLPVLLTCIEHVTGSVAMAPSTTSASSPLQLKVTNICGSATTLEWAAQGELHENPSSQKCELTYHQSRKQNAQIIDIFLDSHSRAIKLFNLTQGESYTAFMVCSSSGKTNEVTFVTDAADAANCEDETTAANHSYATVNADKPVVSSYSHAATFDAVEWPIAITFAVVGVIICAVVAFYMWKKYQRRQRILRIFRQGQNDPFQALYSPTQDSYSF